ncbi:Ca2+/Mg2+-permeable cation channel [Teratosphaeria nubilosa]|uniref:Ca2+/Mg2+-permeable cation channel n=1 Tax=Teratosphaeria nubilosa TaxID=161662 RepID=A0A6G1LKP7_9PEZI|nr:Ca2+/Mg2+-permeable cation channel [Teratosphaeria nubilosa]
MRHRTDVPVPEIHGREGFDSLVRKLSQYFVEQFDAPHTFEELRKAIYPRQLKPLVQYLVDDVSHPAIVAALLALKWHFSVLEANDDRGLSSTRGLACEVTAWRYVTHLTEREAIDALCYELPVIPDIDDIPSQDQEGNTTDFDGTEETPLLDEGAEALDASFYDEDPSASRSQDDTCFASTFANLNALEIAAVVDAKKFLSQKAIQRIIDGIWKGDIVFWETLSTHSKKEAKLYNKVKSDPFCRLRVPLYLKMFEVLFFAAFLAFYYTVLVQKPVYHMSGAEYMLYIWLAAFAYNELVEFWDAGSTFYAKDFWSIWDLGIIATGVAFFIVRVIGLVRRDLKLTDTAFDILSVEALFLVPRICSLLSLHPYFGTLLPSLKAMTKDFVKFLGLVAILYVGFDTTFAFLARGTFSVGKMNWILIKVFFGSSYLGFVSVAISPVLGPPLMFIFVCMTNILLLTSLIALLSNSLTKVIDHAREEYMAVYSVYVLEASTSNRLTYFIPPLNLLPLLLRPLRLVLSAARLRTMRIVLLKATHAPLVGMIMAYELLAAKARDRPRVRPSYGLSSRGRHSKGAPTLLRQPLSVHGAPARPLSPLAVQARCASDPDDTPLKDPTAALESLQTLQRAVDDMKNELRSMTEELHHLAAAQHS